MWAAASFSCPPFIDFASFSNERSPKSSSAVRASMFDYPLASKIMVRNLPYSTDEQFLQKEFSTFGEIAEVKLIKDESTKKSKGYAFIQYTSQDHAMLALENSDHKIYDGRVIYVELAKPRKHDFEKRPRTSGPPKNPRLQEGDVVMEDCWY